MALALNNLKRVDMLLQKKETKETKINHHNPHLLPIPPRPIIYFLNYDNILLFS